MSPATQPTDRLSTALRRRYAAALQLVKVGAIDGELALSYVIWPPATVVEREAKAA